MYTLAGPAGSTGCHTVERSGCSAGTSWMSALAPDVFKLGFILLRKLRWAPLRSVRVALAPAAQTVISNGLLLAAVTAQP